MRRLYFLMRMDSAVHRNLPWFIGICNPDAMSIRIFNPLKAHCKC